ncbi:MAG: hypothetical protein ACKVQU_34590 [Burkholderiales bacterium]
MLSTQPALAADASMPGTVSGRAARLQMFALLAEGERLAFNIATREALLATDPVLKRLFQRQAAQEARHVTIFDCVVRYFCGESDVSSIRNAAGNSVQASAIARSLARAAATGNLPAMVIGLQGVVEGIGVALLESMRPERHADGALFDPIRRMVLAQERAHQHTGERALAAVMSDGRIAYGAAESLLSEALACGHALLGQHEEIFEHVGRPIAAMRAEVTRHAEAFLATSRAIQSGRPI